MSTEPASETALLETFYACFAGRDHQGMAACHHPSASFRDPAFDPKGKNLEKSIQAHPECRERPEAAA
ncbi:MAG TPA: nuclear transport factor 2 family protein [Fibrobacteria bacterium]|nr:nuclear transport factor 2 family protein [Fibrobacteria bacterium]